MDSFEVQRAIVNLIQLTEEEKERGDINRDGSLNIVDATDIQKCVLIIIMECIKMMFLH